MNLAAQQYQYWNDLSHPSMPDKIYVNLEVEAIKRCLGPGKVLDVGCGDGENTQKFSRIKGITVTGIDYATNRLKLAKDKCPRVKFFTADLTQKLLLEKYDYIVSQRFLINLESWEQQKQVIINLINSLKKHGKLVLCEGSLQGNKTLNQFRAKFKLEPIPIRWHNVFIDDNNLAKLGFKLIDGFGGYFLLTRGVRPYFDHDLNWDSQFNNLAKSISLPTKYSRIKVWKYTKK